MRPGALQETGRQRCPHPVRVPRSPGRRPPNLSQPTVCQVFSQQTLLLICMTPPTPFTEANTEPQRVETREAAPPHTHTLSAPPPTPLPSPNPTRSRRRCTGAPKACSAGSQSPSAWRLAARTHLPRADRHCSRCPRPRRSRGVGRGSRPGAPGCRAGGPPESAGEQRAGRTDRRSGEAAGAAQGGRIDLGARGPPARSRGALGRWNDPGALGTRARGGSAGDSQGSWGSCSAGRPASDPGWSQGTSLRAGAGLWSGGLTARRSRGRPPVAVSAPAAAGRISRLQLGFRAESAPRRPLSTRASPPNATGGPSTHLRGGRPPGG